MRFYLIFIAGFIVVTVIVLTVALFSWLHPQSQPATVQTTTSPETTTSSNTTTTTSVSSVQQVQNALENVVKNNPDNIRMGETAISGSFALQIWMGDVTGGEALLQYDPAHGVWTLVDMGGGAWSTSTLEAAGVPEGDAVVLLARMPQ